MKRRIDVVASKESFNNLSTFTDIEEMNKTVRTYRDIIKSSIKRSDVQGRLITLIELLKRHSCKNIGVSYMCKNTIAKKLEVSYKTIQRLVKKLVDLGMIKQVPMKRQKDMLQTSNAIIIVPAEDLSDKQPTKSDTKCPAIKTTSPSLKQNLVINNTYSENPSVDLQPRKISSPYVQFRDMVSNFVKDHKLTNKLYGIYLAQTKNLHGSYESSELLTEGIEALKVTFFATKRKPLRNLTGYFNGTLRKLLDKLYEATMNDFFTIVDETPSKPFYDFIGE